MSADSDRLLDLFRRLDSEQRSMLLAFAEFLQVRAMDGDAEAAPAVPTPIAIPRPEQETVVGAIKRLTRSYPMIDRARVLHKTSALMAEHIMQGRDVVEVIDELEALFRQQYQALVTNEEQGS